MEKIIDLEEAKKVINECHDLNELNNLRVTYLGKKSALSLAMAQMGKLKPEERAVYGKSVNDLKNELNNAINAQKAQLELAKLNETLQKETIDISLPGQSFEVGSKGIVAQVIDEICEICIGLGFSIAEGPEVESDHFNFEMMNIPKGHPARDMQDTFYIDETTLLRSHTSPVQAHVMLAAQGKGPIKVICPGKVYRRDEDTTHSHEFHQIEALVVDKGITMADLKGILLTIARKMFGEKREIRLRSSFFPFTEPSVEVDVSCFQCEGKGCNLCKDTGWIELLGAGMVHPNVLKGAGFDPNVYTGYAFGIGVERVAMLRYGIEDMRYLFANNVNIMKQFKKER
ncbi:MAG: phenylalanine--tRNA ligase subunit alpha [Bacilli bacterium]|nr:phenylalanine--tRNA ligase subunit alpha [Bacilli bacterium]